MHTERISQRIYTLLEWRKYAEFVEEDPETAKEPLKSAMKAGRIVGLKLSKAQAWHT